MAVVTSDYKDDIRTPLDSNPSAAFRFGDLPLPSISHISASNPEEFSNVPGHPLSILTRTTPSLSMSSSLRNE
ncbi:hypothetical protein ACLOJK_018773 [Asimina triloba]